MYNCRRYHNNSNCNFFAWPSLFTALSTTTVLIVILAWLSVSVDSETDILRKYEAKGSYCGSRPPKSQCCTGRQDGCSVPIHDYRTLCYCDQFCNRTHPPGLDDCCPDYKPVCLGIEPQQPIQACYFNDRYIQAYETTKINCNQCTCRPMADRLELVCDQQECLLDGTLIDTVNSQWNRFGWRARNYSEFWGRYLSEGITSRLGTILSTRKVLAMAPISPDYDSRRLPRSFDARQKWRGLIEMPRDQGWCGASWAISTATVISDRMNIHLRSRHMPLSPQHLLSCNTRNQPASGCNGGHLSRAWIFIRRFGLVSEQCFPWVGERTSCFILKRRTANETSRCAPPRINQSSALYRVAPVYRIAGEQDIMFEIQKSGPVQATMRVYQDFFSYGGGIYKCTKISKEHRTGFHSVRIIGWGEEVQNGNLEKYWIVANSWGTDWGEFGFFRIRRGNNDCKIEDFVLAAWASEENTSSINFKDPTSIDNRISNAI